MKKLVFIGFLLLKNFTWAEPYYQLPKSCKGTVVAKEQLPSDPFRFLSSIIHDQGPTGTCGYHAATTLLESLYNFDKKSSDNAHQNVGLSVLHCMEYLGVCPTSRLDFKSAKTSAV